MSSQLELLGWAPGIFSRARPEVCSEQHLKVPKDKSQMSPVSPPTSGQTLACLSSLPHLLILVSLSLPPRKVLNTFSNQYLKEVSETAVESSRPSTQPQV